jgi:hypothetical protein
VFLNSTSWRSCVLWTPGVWSWRCGRVVDTQRCHNETLPDPIGTQWENCAGGGSKVFRTYHFWCFLILANDILIFLDYFFGGLSRVSVVKCALKARAWFDHAVFLIFWDAHKQHKDSNCSYWITFFVEDSLWHSWVPKGVLLAPAILQSVYGLSDFFGIEALLFSVITFTLK